LTFLLVIAIIVLALVLANTRRRLRALEPKPRCERCGDTETVSPFQGEANSYPLFYREPILLCLNCQLAQESWLRHRFMLETEGRFHFGRAKVVDEAHNLWGDRAIDMLALLLVAREDMDQARRLLTSESFEEVRPWLEANVG
jgi:hypothetical protein